jgi:predicted dithiol-disulfide oxidoreductase (DUF899 family)
VARAPIEEIETVLKRMGWRFLGFVLPQRFNYDFNVSFTPEQVASAALSQFPTSAPEWAAGIEDLSGDSVFTRTKTARSSLLTYGRGGGQPLASMDISM